jgi:hypothetical protein
VTPSAGRRFTGVEWQPVVVCFDAELFAVDGSVVVAETLAVFVIVVTGPELTEYVAWMLFVAPAGIAAIVQGYAAQAPEAETNVRRGGVGSEIVTPVASEGPRFVTVTS